MLRRLSVRRHLPSRRPRAGERSAVDRALWAIRFRPSRGDTGRHVFKKPRFSIIANNTKLAPLERKTKNIFDFLSRRCLLVAYWVKGKYERHRRKSDDRGDCGALAMFAGACSKRHAWESPRCACPRSSGRGPSQNSSSALASSVDGKQQSNLGWPQGSEQYGDD